MPSLRPSNLKWMISLSYNHLCTRHQACLSVSPTTWSSMQSSTPISLKTRPKSLPYTPRLASSSLTVKMEQISSFHLHPLSMESKRLADLWSKLKRCSGHTRLEALIPSIRFLQSQAVGLITSLASSRPRRSNMVKRRILWKPTCRLPSMLRPLSLKL